MAWKNYCHPRSLPDLDLAMAYAHGDRALADRIWRSPLFDVAVKGREAVYAVEATEVSSHQIPLPL